MNWEFVYPILCQNNAVPHLLIGMSPRLLLLESFGPRSSALRLVPHLEVWKDLPVQEALRCLGH